MPATSAGGRSVTVSLSARVDGYLAGMAKAQAATEQLTATAARASQTQAWRDTSTSLLRIGAAATAALGLVAKAAADWQSDWAGVEKTVDGTAQQMSRLEDQLRGMARSMPATHTEIAAVAEAAGALGVATGDVAGFTETMIKLGETTNLTADDAATSIAQFTNIMGISRSEVDRLGATLVQLGNNGASTEADIMALAHRLAGVGAQMGMTAADVLALANAMSSVGIEAEAGGTAMTLTLKGIDSAVRGGGAALETYARTAGMTAAQFAAAWGKDAAGATASFIEGLGRIKSEGGDVNKVLEELGIDGVRQADALIRLANATRAAGAQTDLLRDSLAMGAEAWASNSALATEYGKRVDTARAQIEIAWNSIRDAAISAGESTLPAIAGVASAVAGAATKFAELPPAIHTGAAAMTGLIGAGALAAGGVMKAVTAVAGFNAAMASLPPQVQGGVRGLGRLGLAVAGVTAALIAANAVGSAYQAGLDGQRASAEQLEQALTRLAHTGEQGAVGDSFAASQRNMVAANDALAASFVNIKVNGGGFLEWAETTTSNLVAIKGTIQAAREEFSKLDGALASMPVEESAQAFTRIREELVSVGATTDDLVALFPQYASRLEATAHSMGVYNLSAQDLASWMEGIEPRAIGVARLMAELGQAHVQAGASAAEQAAALRTLMEVQEKEAMAALAASNAEIAYHRALDAAATAAAEVGATVDEATGRFDLWTDAGRQAQAALDQIASAALRSRDAMAESGAATEQLTAFTAEARDQFIAAATQMGMTAEQAAALADRYGLIPSQVVTDVSTPGAVPSRAEMEALYDALARIPAERHTEVKSAFEAGGIAAAYAALSQIDGRVATTYINTVYRQYAESQGAVTETSTHGGIPIASGGAVFGPGTATSDSIPAWLSNGEFVIRAAAAEAIGYDRLAWMNRWGELPRFADGGRAHPDASTLVAPNPARLWTAARQRPPAARVGRPAVVTQHVYGANEELIWADLGRGLRKAGL